MRIETLRIARGWNRPTLAKRVGTTKDSVYLWERENQIPRRATFLRLLKVLGLTEGQFWADDFPRNLGRKAA